MTGIATPLTAGPMGPEQARVIELIKGIVYLTPSDDDFLQRKAGAWANRTLTQVKTDLGIPDILRNQIRLAMQMADVRNTVAGLGNGIGDTFDDTSGVDAAASTNQLAQAGYYTNLGNFAVEGAQTLPAMTTNSAPAGHIALADSENGVDIAYKAFDQSSGFWSANGKTLPKWVQRKTPSAIRVGAYKVKAPSNATYAPVAFDFQGSNDGSAWTTLNSQSGQSWSSSEEKSYTITNGSRASYLYHRLNVVTAGAGADVRINELSLLQDLRPLTAMDLRSVAFTAAAVPAAASLTVAASAIGGSITPNTNLIAYVSRDGGTTWTQGTLTARADPISDGSTIYETGEISISGQPSGTSMLWRLVTTSAVEIRINAVGLYWR